MKFLISDTYLVIVMIFLKITSLSLGSLIVRVCWLIEMTHCVLATCLEVCCLTVLKYLGRFHPFIGHEGP